MRHTHNGTYLRTIFKRKSLEIPYSIDNIDNFRYLSECKILYFRTSNDYGKHRALYYLKPI